LPCFAKATYEVKAYLLLVCSLIEGLHGGAGTD
jgi:hypothetical protein